MWINNINIHSVKERQISSLYFYFIEIFLVYYNCFYLFVNINFNFFYLTLCKIKVLFKIMKKIIIIIFLFHITILDAKISMDLKHKYYFSNIMNFGCKIEYPLKYFKIGLDLKYLLNYENELPFQYYSGAILEKFGSKYFFMGVGIGVSYGYNEIVGFSSYFLYGNLKLINFIRSLPIGINTDIEYFSGSMNLYPDVYLKFKFSKKISAKMGMANLVIIDFRNDIFYRSGVFWGIKYEF